MSQTTDRRFEINPVADLTKIGGKVTEALIAVDECDIDSTRDIIFELYGYIFPNACKVMTPEETRQLYHREAMHCLHIACGHTHAFDDNDPVILDIRGNITHALQLLDVPQPA